MSISTRYVGKPLLRLLECYVLKAINELNPADEFKLATMVPDLARIYKQSGTWDQIIAATMDLPDHMPSLIRQMWDRNRDIAQRGDLRLLPQQFAEMFVDQNLT